jgi:hypothetical protein
MLQEGWAHRWLFSWAFYNVSQDAVIIPGASLSCLSMKMPGRKDARTSEKLVYPMKWQGHF